VPLLNHHVGVLGNAVIGKRSGQKAHAIAAQIPFRSVGVEDAHPKRGHAPALLGMMPSIRGKMALAIRRTYAPPIMFGLEVEAKSM
jgi:hypothetical protein